MTGISPFDSQKDEPEENQNVQLAIVAPVNPDLICYSSAQRLNTDTQEESKQIGLSMNQSISSGKHQSQEENADDSNNKGYQLE